MTGLQANIAFRDGVASAADSQSMRFQAVRPQEPLPELIENQIFTIVALVNSVGDQQEARRVIEDSLEEASTRGVSSVLIVLAPLTPFEADAALVELLGQLPTGPLVDGVATLEEFSHLVEQHMIDLARDLPEVQTVESVQEDLLQASSRPLGTDRGTPAVVWPRRRS